MDKRQLENRVLSLIEMVKKGSKIEDTTIELKSEWPDEQKAARQLAGLANAARGEPVYWIVGVDEDASTVVGAESKEQAIWLPKVKSFFEGNDGPNLLVHVNVHDGDKVVPSFYFETDLSPYVVRNPSFGKPDGGPVKYEVPWREGAATRTATRADLLKILVKAAKRPIIEVLKAEMRYSRHADGKERWELHLVLFGTPQSQSPVTLHSHSWSFRFLHVFSGTEMEIKLRTIRYRESREGSVAKGRVTFDRPMVFRMLGTLDIPGQTNAFPDEIKGTVRFGIPGEDNLEVQVPLEMNNMVREETGVLSWRQGADSED